MGEKKNTNKNSSVPLLAIVGLMLLVAWVISFIFSRDWVVIRNYGIAPEVAIIQDGDSGEKFKSAEECMVKASYLKQMSQDDAWYICGRKCKQEGTTVICEEFKR